jgi:uncharacterized membrane protein
MNQESESKETRPTEIAPDVGSAYGHGWRIMWAFFLELLAITIVAAVISGPSWWWSRENMDIAISVQQPLSFIFSILVVGPLEFGVAFASLKAVRSDRPKIVDMFEGFRTYWNAVAASILLHVIIVIGFIILIVPGIIFACKLAFVPYLVVERKMDAIDAIRESWRLTRGHAMKVFLVYLVAIPVALAGLLALGVGVIISIIWIRLAVATLYHAVTEPRMQTVEGTPV